MRVLFSPPDTNQFWHQLDILQLIQLWHQLPRVSIRPPLVWKPVPQNECLHVRHRCQASSCQVTHTFAWLGYKVEGSHHALPVLIICYNDSQNSGKHLTCYNRLNILYLKCWSEVLQLSYFSDFGIFAYAWWNILGWDLSLNKKIYV
jgi:hypothetical protein